jgi:flagellar motor switch/type III secretory pathway protein FliN
MSGISKASVRPFPFAALPSLTRADVAQAARLRRVTHALVDVEGIERALADLVGEPVTIALRSARRMQAPPASDDATGAVLALAGAPAHTAHSRRVLVEVEGALAAALSTRALRQKSPRLVDASRTPSPALAGSFAAVLVAALRRAHAGGVLKVVAAGPGAVLARDLLQAERDVTTATLTVTIGEDAFEARVSVPDALAEPPRELLFSRASLLAMGDATIAMPLVMTTTLASREDLFDLGMGDVLVPSKNAFALREDGAVHGAVAIVAASAERGLSADLAEDGRLVVRGLLESHPWQEERSMPKADGEATTIESLEHAPVVVRVELGTVEMKAREWAELGPGDVIALGRRIGDPAILRVGGVELARGELVQVDGEYGVRILARTGMRAGTDGGSGA